MNSSISRLLGHWVLAFVLLIAGALRSTACTDPLPQPPLWVLELGLNANNNDEYLIGVELGQLFTDIEPGQTACACGLRFSSPLPFGSSVTDAFVAVTNRQTHEMTLVPGFDFDPNPLTSDALAGFTESFDWFGLATEALDSVVQPVLGPGEALKLWYRVEIVEFQGESATAGVEAAHGSFDPAEAFSADNMLFAAGGANADGRPILSGPHSVHLFRAVEVPEPISASSALVGSLALAGIRPRRRG